MRLTGDNLAEARNGGVKAEYGRVVEVAVEVELRVQGIFVE